MKGCLRKRGLDVRQARRMVGVCEGECMEHITGNEPLTLKRCHSYMKTWMNMSVAELTISKVYRSKFLFFISFTVAHFMT